MVTLTTPAEVLDQLVKQLGTVEAVRKLTHRRDGRVVANWRHRGFPPDTAWVVRMELRKSGFKVDPKVFGISPALYPVEDA